MQSQALALGESTPGAASAGPSRARTGAAVLPISEDGTLKMSAAAAREVGESLAGEYSFAEPFPHIVLDNFLPESVARMALEELPKRPLESDINFEMGYAGQFKRQILPEDCGERARQLFHFFNSAPMLQFLEGLTNIPSLIPDPYFSGGGYHETGRGGYLGVHADFRVNETLHVHRRINVIIYLNENWPEEYGGNLELWERDMSKCRATVRPLFNRCVVFNTDADSYHGHPDPLTCPPDAYRRSIALYYYTASKEIYKEVPNMGTVYQARPTDDASVKSEARSLRVEQYMRQWLPPALQRYAFAIRRRLKSR